MLFGEGKILQGLQVGYKNQAKSLVVNSQGKHFLSSPPISATHYRYFDPLGTSLSSHAQLGGGWGKNRRPSVAIDAALTFFLKKVRFQQDQERPLLCLNQYGAVYSDSRERADRLEPLAYVPKQLWMTAKGPYMLRLSVVI